MADGFRAHALPAQADAFAALLAPLRLEDVGPGRRAAVLVDASEAGVPIVRTTTAYASPAQPFAPVHRRLAGEIQRRAALPLAFNNVLVELYTPAYTRMGSHSDQALDLADGSAIAVYSAYRDPGRPSRRLVVEPKAGGAISEVALLHGHVVVFSLETNRRSRHKIVPAADTADNEWLGLTFRTSKTLVRFDDGTPRLADGTPLVLADDEQRQVFFRLRRQENQAVDFVYPPVPYTLSDSDRRPPRA